eukprot:7723311-Karenia_brevis.AAC.1
MVKGFKSTTTGIKAHRATERAKIGKIRDARIKKTTLARYSKAGFAFWNVCTQRSWDLNSIDNWEDM